MKQANGTGTWSSQSDFAACTGKGISVTEDVVRLRRGVTFADEMGNCNQHDREAVSGLRQARKTFFIPEVGASRALLCPYLLCDRADGELDIDVNGHSLRVVWPGDRSYWEDRWQPLEIPSDWLGAGRNEVTFRAVEDATWTLLIEESVQPKRSAVSEDGGLTWRSGEMGVNDRACGEYMVRLWLDQYVESGEVCSNAVDLLRLVSTDGIAAAGSVDAIRLSADVRTPAGCTTALQWRGGPCPAYCPKTWTAWAPASDPIAPTGPIRFPSMAYHIAVRTAIGDAGGRGRHAFGNGRRGYTAGGKNRRFRQPGADTKLVPFFPSAGRFETGTDPAGALETG